MIDEFELEASKIKEACEINNYLNTHLGVVISEKDLFEPVLTDVRYMSVKTLAMTFGQFSLDYRIEMRKRRIESMLDISEKTVFPTVVRYQRGVEVRTAPRGPFKAKSVLFNPTTAFA